MRWREFITFLGGTVTMTRWSVGVMILVIWMVGYQLGRKIELDSVKAQIDDTKRQIDATKRQIDSLTRPSDQQK